MNVIKNKLASKTVMQYIAYAAALVGFVADIIFLIVDGSDQTFTIGCFVCVLLGSLVALSDFFKSFLDGIALWFAVILYSVGIGFHLYEALPSISDLWNNIVFIGGNQQAAIVFGIIFLAVTVVLIVANFTEGKRDPANEMMTVQQEGTEANK